MVNDPISYRVGALFLSIPQAIMMAPFGNGLGTEQIAGNYYASGRMSFTTMESEAPRIILEIGLIGFLGVVTTYLGAIYTLWSARKITSDPKLKTVFLVVTLICAAWAFTGVLFNHVASFFFWTVVTAALAIGNER
jgi:O-antigen ligase